MIYLIKGKLVVQSEFRFRLGGLLFLYGVQPVLEKIFAYLGENRCRKLATVLFSVVFIDFIATMVYRVL